MYDYWDLLKMYEKTKKENNNLKSKLFDKENIIKEIREYIEQLLEYKKTNKVIHKEFVERIIDIINQDKRY